MKQKILLVLCVLFVFFANAQQPSHRMKFKYRITQKKLDALAANGLILKDAKGKKQDKICGKILKAMITIDKGVLIVDPWAIKDKRVNPVDTEEDPCYGVDGTVNATTPYPLTINIKRGLDAIEPHVGHPTIPAVLHYQTWLIGVNALGAKIRPQVKDFNGNEYSANAITGTFNLGLNVGYSFGWTTFTHRSANSFSITPALGLGFSAASLSKEPLKKQVNVAFNPSNFILSPAFSVIVARNDIGIMLSYGHDFMLGQNASAWAYQGKRYFGIGVAANFKL
jgi:hypothetical protein